MRTQPTAPIAAEERVYGTWYALWLEPARQAALRIFSSALPPEAAYLAAEEVAYDLMESAVWDNELRTKTTHSSGAYLLRAARNRAIDELRRGRRSYSLDQFIAHDQHGDERPDYLPILRRSQPLGHGLLAPSADEAYSLLEIERAAEEHERLNRWFSEWAYERLKCRSGEDKRLRRRLFTGARSAIVQALFSRPSLLAALLHSGPRDVYDGASDEGARLSRKTRLSAGRVRNLRTELIDLLRVELLDEVGSVLSRLATLWDTTLEGARDLHLRWAEAA